MYQNSPNNLLSFWNLKITLIKKITKKSKKKTKLILTQLIL